MDTNSHTLSRLFDHKLLDSAASLALARRIKRGTVLPTTPGEVTVYTPDAEAACYELVQGNMRFIATVIQRFGPATSHEFEDLVSASVPYALRAAKSWDPARADSFLAALEQWVKAAVWDHRRHFSFGVTSVTGYQRSWLSKVGRARTKLADELGRDPTQAEVVEKTAIPPEKVVEFWNRPYLVEIEGGEHFAGSAGTNKSNVTNQSRIESQMDAFVDLDPVRDTTDRTSDTLLARAALEGALTEREKAIVSMLYGIDGASSGMTLEAVGERLGVTRERIRQIRGQAFRKLRRFAERIRKADEGDSSARTGLEIRQTAG
jgi:RNA polymerase primary sigma factor